MKKEFILIILLANSPVFADTTTTTTVQTVGPVPVQTVTPVQTVVTPVPVQTNVIPVGTVTTVPVRTTVTPVRVQTVRPANQPTVIINNNVSSRPMISDADANIISGIYTRFSRDSALTGTSLNVTSDNGVVTITGNVTQQSQADEAVLVVKAMPGVQTVISKINVLTNPNASVPIQPKNY